MRTIPLIGCLIALTITGQALAGKQTHMIPWTGDWEQAIQRVQTPYPGSATWLLNCSASEGGHGQWVPNRQGSGAGGWMQYMNGTFWHDYTRAISDLHARGYAVPASTATWYSPLGQAIAAGWAYGHERPPGKWVGWGC